jgi:SAM-dependent methyltransferase
MRSLARAHHGESGGTSACETPGLVLDWGWRYDLVVWLFDVVSRGKLREIRRRALDLADLRGGEAVLDVGCGTGTLALEAYERVGATGRVAGVDPAPRQIARARSKAARRGASVDFQVGAVERLAFPDRSFDAVLSTWMMHHLPDDLKRRGLAEIARVLGPDGRLVIVDAEHRGHRGHHGRATRLGAGELGIQELPALMRDAGFSRIETWEARLTGLPRFPRAGIALGRKSPAGEGSASTQNRL